MSAPRPVGPRASLDLLRQLTDRHVLDQLLTDDHLTRAQIAARTGISKPTISESMRRLTEDGLVTETGQQVGRRGRAGTYYSLRSDVGVALAISASQDGLVAELSDVRGQVVARQERSVPVPVTAARLDPLLRDLIVDVLAQASAPVLGSALSVAGPIDRSTGRLVRLPDSPFLVDEFDPRALLGDLLGPPLQIDNDVNWAATAEHREGNAQDLEDFCYCHLGHGLGGAVVQGGVPVRGSAGLTGEIAHVRTVGPRGRSLRLAECFAALELLVPRSATIDVARVRQVLQGSSAADRRKREAVVAAVAGVVTSLTALLNPAAILLGGPWSDAGHFAHQLAERVDAEAVVPTEVRPAGLIAEAPLTGARSAAVRALHDAVLARE
jgi:predicted NBD/HSP70 family sugar kinase/biotin operon repressor